MIRVAKSLWLFLGFALRWTSVHSVWWERRYALRISSATAWSSVSAGRYGWGRREARGPNKKQASEDCKAATGG